MVAYWRTWSWQTNITWGDLVPRTVPRSLMWSHVGFQQVYTVLVFLRNKTLLKRGREKHSAPIQFQRHFKGNQFFMNIIFIVRWKNFGKVLVWSAQEGALKNRRWRGLTMPPLCCDSVSLRCSEQRNGKDYPQECLGCPQTERSARPANGRARPSGGLIFSWWTQPPAP